MPRSLTSVVLLGAVAFASCTPAEVSPALTISVTSNAFLMRGVEYKSKGELTAALKTLKPPQQSRYIRSRTSRPIAERRPSRQSVKQASRLLSQLWAMRSSPSRVRPRTRCLTHRWREATLCERGSTQDVTASERA